MGVVRANETFFLEKDITIYDHRCLYYNINIRVTVYTIIVNIVIYIKGHDDGTLFSIIPSYEEWIS